MSRIMKLSVSVVAVCALVFALSGTASAAVPIAPAGSIHTDSIANGAVTNTKLGNGSVGFHKLNGPIRGALDYLGQLRAKLGGSGLNGLNGLQGPKGDTGATGAQGPQGPKGDTGAAGQNGTNGTNGTDGTDGADGGPQPGTSSQNCTPDLCIDAAPGDTGSQGSGGFGWDNTANAPVTNLTVGNSYTFTVTALQTSPQASGQITLNYDTDYLTYVSNSDTSATCVDHHSDSDVAAGWVTCSYTDFAHTDKGDGFQFTANAATAETVVTDTVTTNGEQATQTVPIQIGS